MKTRIKQKYEIREVGVFVLHEEYSGFHRETILFNIHRKLGLFIFLGKLLV